MAKPNDPDPLDELLNPPRSHPLHLDHPILKYKSTKKKRGGLKLPQPAKELEQGVLETAVHIDEIKGKTGVRIGQDLDTKEVLWLTDRFRHMYMIGTSGSGKTNLLRQMIEADMRDGHGVGVLAKENDQIERETLPFVPKERIHETVYLNPTAKHPLCLNPLELPKGIDLHQHVAELLTIFSALLSISAFTQVALCRYMLYALVAHPESSLEHIPKFLGEDKDYRWGIINEVKHHYDMDMIIEAFERFDSPKNPQKAAAFYIIEKFIPFVLSPKLKAIMCGKTTLSLSEIMQSKGIFIANLSDAGGVLGETESSLLGAYLITAIKREMSNRQEMLEHERANYPFMLYVDEFTKYLSEKSNEEAFAEFLIRARKNYVALHLAHQDTADLSDNLNTKLGGTGARVFLNLTPPDAQRAARFIVLDDMGEDVTVGANKLTKMTPGECYVSVYHDETKSKEWHHAQTFEFKGKGDPEIAQQIIEQSSTVEVTSDINDKAPDVHPDRFESNQGTSPPLDSPKPPEERYRNTEHSLDDFTPP